MEIFNEATKVAPAVIVKGNHDADGDLEKYVYAASKWPILFSPVPTIHAVMTPAGPLGVYALPYPKKKYLVEESSEDTVEGQKQEYEQGLRAILSHWRVEAGRRRE